MTEPRALETIGDGLRGETAAEDSYDDSGGLSGIEQVVIPALQPPASVRRAPSELDDANTNVHSPICGTGASRMLKTLVERHDCDAHFDLEVPVDTALPELQLEALGNRNCASTRSGGAKFGNDFEGLSFMQNESSQLELHDHSAYLQSVADCNPTIPERPGHSPEPDHNDDDCSKLERLINFPLSDNASLPTVFDLENGTSHDLRNLFPVDPDEEKNPTNYLHRIISDKSLPLLMLGEGSKLSMTIAVAFMRGSFDKIYSSTYQLRKRPCAFAELQQLVDCQRQAVRGAATRDATSANLCPDDVPRITLAIDATNLSAALNEYPNTPTDLIWFPFPCKVGKTAQGLLKNTIESAASIQGTKAGGGVLLISLSRNPSYACRYGEMSEILCHANKLGYECLVEEKFIKTTCCEFGYRHRWEGQDSGGRSIHDRAINLSSTHVFIMRPKFSSDWPIS